MFAGLLLYASTIEFQGQDTYYVRGIQYDLRLMGLAQQRKDFGHALFEVRGREGPGSDSPAEARRHFVPTGECSDLLRGDQLLVLDVQIPPGNSPHTADYCLIAGR